MLSIFITLPLLLMPDLAHEGVRETAIQVCDADMSDVPRRMLWERIYEIQCLLMVNIGIFRESVSEIDDLIRKHTQTSPIAGRHPLYHVLMITRSAASDRTPHAEADFQDAERLAQELEILADQYRPTLAAKAIHMAMLVQLRQRARRGDVARVAKQVRGLLEQPPNALNRKDQEAWLEGLAAGIGSLKVPPPQLEQKRRLLKAVIAQGKRWWDLTDETQSRSLVQAHFFIATTWGVQGDIEQTIRALDIPLRWCAEEMSRRPPHPDNLAIAASMCLFAAKAYHAVNDGGNAVKYAKSTLWCSEQWWRRHPSSTGAFCNHLNVAFQCAVIARSWDLQLAAQILQHAAEQADRAERPTNPRSDKFLGQIYVSAGALICDVRGRNASLPYDRRGLQILRSIPEDNGDRCRLLLSAFVSIARKACIHGEYVLAHELLVEADRTIQNCPHRDRIPRATVANVLLQKGCLAAFEHDNAAAVEFLEQGLTMTPDSRRASLNYLQMSALLATTLGTMRRYDEATALFEHLNRRCERAVNSTDSDRVRVDWLDVMQQQYRIERMRQNREGARRIRKEVLHQWEQIGHNEALLELRGIALQMRDYWARSAFDVGDYETAMHQLELLEELALTNSRKGTRRDYNRFVSIPAFRCEVLMACGRYEAAANAILKASAFEPRLFYDAGIRRSADTCVRQLMSWQRASHLLLSVEEKAELDCEVVYEHLLPYRGLVFRLLLDQQRRRSVLTPQVRQVYERYVAARDRLAEEEFRRGIAGAKAGSEEAKGDFEVIEQVLRAEADLQRLQAPTPDETRFSYNEQLPAIRASLRHGEVILDFIEYEYHDWDTTKRGWDAHRQERRYRAYVIARGQPLRYVDLGLTDEVDQAILRWRDEVSRGRPIDCGTRLSKLLWHPISKLLPAEASRIYICPSGRISLISWAALPMGATAEPLLSAFEFGYLPYAKFLTRRASPTSSWWPPSTAVAVGDVDYGTAARIDVAGNQSSFARSAISLSPLPGTRRELEQIRRSVGRLGVREFAGHQATRSALVPALREADWIHIASHGMIADQSRVDAYLQSQRRSFWPEWSRAGVETREPFAFSAIALSRAAAMGGPETRLLASQVAALRLHRHPVVVLSACDTARGPIVANEGVFSLDKAFLVAGARAVISAIWAVPDDSTAVLMEAFYNEMAKPGANPSKALRHAQLSVIRRSQRSEDRKLARGPNVGKTVPLLQNRDGIPSPIYWGGMICSGFAR